MKLFHHIFVILFFITLSFASVVTANECKEMEGHDFLFCGDWSVSEADNLMDSLLGDEPIYKIIKENDNLYFLYTCDDQIKGSSCVRGFVQVIDRSEFDCIANAISP